MRISLRTVTGNWRLKLTALALAVLLWAVVSAEQVTTQWIPVRVDAVVRDPGYVLMGGADPGVVRVRFSGPGRELWEVALARPILELRVNEVGNARTFVLDPQMVQLRSGLRVRAEDVRPATVRLDVQHLVSREVPVRPRIGSRSLARYSVGDSVHVTPARVRLTGPESAVASLDSVDTRTFELFVDGGAFTQQAGFDTAALHRRGITVSSRQVEVSGAAERIEALTVGGVAVDAPPGLAAVPARVDVQLRGPARRLREMDRPALRVLVDADLLRGTLPLSGASAAVIVRGLPRGITATAAPARVRLAPTAIAPPPAAPAASPLPPADSASPPPAAPRVPR